MSQTYFAIPTVVGEANIANAQVTGKALLYTRLSVGDGGSDNAPVPTPNRQQKALIGERHAVQINRVYRDPENPAYILIEAVLPADVGGWWIREIGVWDEENSLAIVANCAPSYKPLLASGAARDQVIRVAVIVSGQVPVELKIDPAVVLATRGYVDEGLTKKLDKTATAVAAAKLATARTITVTGDLSGSVSFDGTKNVSFAGTLAATGVVAGAYGSESTVPVITLDAKGRATKAESVPVGNAQTATKLAAARNISMSGAVTAAGKAFDGTAAIQLEATSLDVSKATLGILSVARGGTGLGAVAAGAFVSGNGTGALVPRTPAQVLVDIGALSAKGGTVEDGVVLFGSGASLGVQYGAANNVSQTAHVLLPDGGGYSTNTQTVVGAMKITLPPAAIGVNTMLRMRVSVFEYGSNAPMEIYLSGYVQGSKTWARSAANFFGSDPANDFPVRFGSDDTGNLCIWLGDLSQTWVYPSVVVAEVAAKYNAAGAKLSGWGTGWKVEPVTVFGTVSATVTNNLAFARSDIERVSGLTTALGLKANVATSLVAGNGLSGGGDLSANRTFTLGTPGAITKASTNAVTATSHTHQLTLSAADIGAAAANVTLTAGNGLTGGGDWSANRTLTLGTPGTITATTGNSVATDSHTHSLSIVPADIGAAPASVTVTAGNGLSGGGTIAASRTLTLGTPSKLGATSTNSVTATSHTHELDTQQGSNDATTGRLLTVGNAFGLGADNPLGTSDLNSVVLPGFYGQSANANATLQRNYPVPSAGSLVVGSAGSQITTHTYTVYNTGAVYSRARYGDIWSDWKETQTVEANPLSQWAGAIAYFARSTPPAGWLRANGSAVLVSAYQQLATAIYPGNALNASAEFGYRCTNAASPNTTRSTTGAYIVLPDLRGEFPRGWDDGRGVDASRVFGSSQTDLFKAHRHTMTSAITRGGSGLSGQGERVPFVADTYEVASMTEGGTETRPRNVALLACILY